MERRMDRTEYQLTTLPSNPSFPSPSPSAPSLASKNPPAPPLLLPASSALGASTTKMPSSPAPLLPLSVTDRRCLRAPVPLPPVEAEAEGDGCGAGCTADDFRRRPPIAVVPTLVFRSCVCACCLYCAEAAAAADAEGEGADVDITLCVEADEEVCGRGGRVGGMSSATVCGGSACACGFAVAAVLEGAPMGFLRARLAIVAAVGTLQLEALFFSSLGGKTPPSGMSCPLPMGLAGEPRGALGSVFAKIVMGTVVGCVSFSAVVGWRERVSSEALEVRVDVGSRDEDSPGLGD